MIMKEKTSYIFGALTITAVLGFTAYSIVAYKRQAKKEQEEEVITVDQAQKEIEEFENREIEERYESGETENLREPMVEMGPEEYEHYDEITEEDEVLRHEPNSIEARDQFIAMNLAEWRPGTDTYEKLLYLFTFPFSPTTEGDRILREKLVDERRNFFGEESKWNARVTYAEVVLYFARETEFNVDGVLDDWVNLFLDNMGMTQFLPSEEVDDILNELNTHSFFNGETDLFGLFGLDDDELENAYAVADIQVDTAVTYEILYNEFLKGVA